MVAELCCHTQGPAVDRAWAILDESLDFFRAFIADGGSGMLWKPIDKLLKRARERRAEALKLRPPSNLLASGTLSPTNLGITSSVAESKATPPPRTANAAMAFTPYMGPPPDGTSLGLSPEEIEAATASTNANGWQLPHEFKDVDMTFDNIGNLGVTDSPDTAWQNWGLFMDGVNQEALFPAQSQDAQRSTQAAFPGSSPLPWLMGLSQGNPRR